MRSIARGGEYLRVADPDWDDPLDGDYARMAGGRWNAPGSFPVVYLCRTLAVARANVYRRLAGHPYGPEDLASDRGPVLVTTHVPEGRFVDVVTTRGCVSAGLPATYPVDATGAIVAHGACQTVGAAAWTAGEPGIACRTAAGAGARVGEELAWFVRRRRLRRAGSAAFEDWFW